MPLSEVHNIDCMEYLRSLPDNAFDLACVDPPYGPANAEISGGRKRPFNRFAGGTRFQQYLPTCGTTEAASPNTDSQPDRRNVGEQVRKKIIGWDEAPSEEYFKELFRVSKHQIIWGANYFPNMPPTRCFIVWRKLTISEQFTMAMAEYAWTSFNTNAKVFECAPQGKKSDPRFHPTQKPVELYTWTFRNFAADGWKILDTHMGSQSSRIAAYALGFDYVGCEIDSEYFDRGCERFDRECRGITTTKQGQKIIQPTLF